MSVRKRGDIMIINMYKYNKECEEVLDEWNNGLYSHLILHLPKYGGVKEEVFTLRLAEILNKESGSKRNLDESYLYLKYSKDISEHKRKLFFDSPSVIAKNYNEFDGVFVVDISDWINHVYTSEFKELLEYIVKNSKTMKFIFVIHASDKDKSLELVNILSEVINLKEVSLTYPDIDYFMVYLRAVLGSKGVNTDVMRNQLLDLITNYYQSDEFRGYETLDKLAEHIVYLVKKNNDIDFTELYKAKNKKTDKDKRNIGF